MKPAATYSGDGALGFTSTGGGGQGGRKIHKRKFFWDCEAAFSGSRVAATRPTPAPTLQQRQVTLLAMPPMRVLVSPDNSWRVNALRPV